MLFELDKGVEERRLLESTIEHVRALKGFIAETWSSEGEHDQLKRQMTDSLGEVEMLRNLVQQLKVQQDQFSNALSALTSEMEDRRKEGPALQSTRRCPGRLNLRIL